MIKMPRKEEHVRFKNYERKKNLCQERHKWRIDACGLAS